MLKVYHSGFRNSMFTELSFVKLSSLVVAAARHTRFFMLFARLSKSGTSVKLEPPTIVLPVKKFDGSPLLGSL